MHVSLDCQPIVSPPTFDAIYANVIQTSCSVSGGSCHSSTAHSRGLDMGTVDAAYAGLSSRVDAASPGCGVLIERVESTDATFRMPPGPNPLSEAQRCAIRRWIADGAKR